MAVVGFLHTAAVHEPTFDALVAELAPELDVRTIVDEALLAAARARGPVAVRDQVAARLGELAGADMVVCTCSTIGGIAEDVGAELGLQVVRVDRPMAERAVEIGGRVVVVAALESTLGPTRRLIESVAAARSAEITIEVALVDGAWERFEAGDHDGFLDAIAGRLPALARRADVVVLAQASMAAAAERADRVEVPVLSSPRLAVAALA
jgi:aspartate/glutamate racemase